MYDFPVAAVPAPPFDRPHVPRLPYRTPFPTMRLVCHGRIRFAERTQRSSGCLSRDGRRVPQVGRAMGVGRFRGETTPGRLSERAQILHRRPARPTFSRVVSIALEPPRTVNRACSER